MYTVFVNADDIARTQGVSNAQAADLATAERERRILQCETFAFETVFSRTDYWLGFIFQALSNRYRIELYFLCTDDPTVNLARVETRVEMGGHSVASEKIFKRYPGSIHTALLAKTLVDEFWLYDNTRNSQSPALIGHFTHGKLDDIGSSIPHWALPFFLETPLV